MRAMQHKSIFDQAGVEAKMAGRLPPDEKFRPVHHSEVVTIQVEVTRPADTAAYIAGDVIGAAGDPRFVFPIEAQGIPAGLIIAGRLIRDSVGNSSVRFTAGVHDAAPATLPAGDNAPSPLLYGNRASRRGWIDFPSARAGAAAGSNCLEYAGVLSNAQGIPVSPADGNLTVLLSTLDGFVPASGEKFTIELDLVA